MRETKELEYIVDPDSGRFWCNTEHPMPKNADGRWVHENVEEVGEDYGQGGGVTDGDYVKNCCKDCGFTWWQELPN